MMKIKNLILLITFFSLISLEATAGNCALPSDFTISYNPCTGLLHKKYLSRHVSIGQPSAMGEVRWTWKGERMNFQEHSRNITRVYFSSDSQAHEEFTNIYEYVPQEFIEESIQRIDFWFNWGGGCDRLGAGFANINITRSTPTDIPSGFTVSDNDFCDYIYLRWDAIDNYSNCSKSFVDIQRKKGSSDFTTIATLSHDVTEYYDYSVDKGAKYEYKIRERFQPSPYISRFSPQTSVLEGRSKGFLAPATDLTATTTDCHLPITISWQYTGEIDGLSGFEIERRVSDTSDWSSIGSISSDDATEYKDDPPKQDVEYEYRIITLNDCDPSDKTTSTLTTKGVQPGPPPEPYHVSSTSNNKSITITWDIDFDENEPSNFSQFILERTVIGATTAPLEIPIDRLDTSYIDSDVFNCVTYVYTLKSQGICYGDIQGDPIGSDTTANLVELDLSQAFATDGSAFEGSTGYFSDKVQLTWVNKNSGQTNQVRIYRRVLGSGQSFALLNSVPDDSGIYNDFSAEAGVIYEYEIIADGPCENSTVSTNRVGTVGFRSKSGQVTGNVSYTGGIAVKDVKIVATRDDIITGSSLLFNAGELTIPHNENQTVTKDFLVEAWIKPAAYTKGFSILSKLGAYTLGYDHNREMYKAIIQTESSEIFETEISSDSLLAGQWSHIGMQVRNDSLFMIVNGKTLNGVKISGALSNIKYAQSALSLGQSYTGYMKEVRLWNVHRTANEIERQHSAYVSGTTPGMIVYLPLDEGAGNYAYDRSQVSVSIFNRNHAEINGIMAWSSDIPTIDQLSYAAYTDAQGNYRIKLPYTNAGETYELSPIYKTHEFDPSSRILFVGDASSVINEVDFEDISAFRVTGSVFFDGMSCPSEGVLLKIDGQAVVKQGLPVFTDANGDFDIEVPIGDHVITLEKSGHTFSAGRWPSTGTHDFQDDVSGIEFKDGTLRKVVGRVVGGTIEGAKIPGLGRSINNIGSALLTFDPQRECGWEEGARDTTLISTNVNTGEYELLLPPLIYKVLRVHIPSNADITFENSLLDLTNANFENVEIDTVRRDGDKEVIRIDSVGYNKRFDFIYRSDPSIDVQLPGGGGPLTGDESYFYSNGTNREFSIDLIATPLPYPIFSQSKRYRANISTFEEYVNHESGISDRVPITNGKLTINNELAENGNFDIDLPGGNYSGDTIITFVGGQPNLQTNSLVADYDFTREFRVDLISGAKSSSWQPNSNNVPPNGNGYFRAYILGTKDVEESDFVTQGPQSVDYVLRDPPGSQSFSSRAESTKHAVDERWAWDAAGGFETNQSVFVGQKFATGIGFLNYTDVRQTVKVEVNAKASGGGNKSVISTTTNLNEWKTSDDPLFAGASSDLFVGSSHNYIFGVATSLVIVPDSICNTVSTIDCIASIGGYRIAREKNLALAKGAVQTEFIYTAIHIETNEIPQLEELRNAYISNDSRYQSKLSLDHPCFGFNNDDERLSTSACPNTSTPTPDAVHTTYADRDGPSYFFNAPVERIDSVRLFNQQIRLWKDALAQNEKEKALAREKEDNYSFSGGGASFTSTVVTASETTTTNRIEFLFEEKLTSSVGAKLGGVGVINDYSLLLEQSRKQETATTNGSERSISFTLSDDSEWDAFTVDVYKDSPSGGPIFKTLAGRSSCPHEGEVVSKYYRPGTTLSPGTIQLEQPEVSISPSILYNVPQGERGVFQLKLTNNNPIGDTWEYATKLVKNSNPNSLNVNVGFADDITGNWVIPDSTTLTRDLFAEIGNGYEYDSLMVVLHSTCQYRQGISEEKDIADTAYLSIHFIPECTAISLANPSDQWVLNSSFNNELTITAEEYNINHLNFESLQLEYKPNNEADWIALQKYYKDTTGVIGDDLRQISTSSSRTSYAWNVAHLPDGAYDLRATTDCTVATAESPVYSGYIDRVNPHAFGTPSPADGVLDPNDDILLKFNEPVSIGSVTSLNFDVRAVKNGSELRHETSLSFDGVDDYAEVVPYQLQKRSFTIETWLKRNGSGQAAIFSQGNQAEDQILFGLDENDKVILKLGNKEVVSNLAITDDKWHHVAVTYNREFNAASIVIDFVLSRASNNFGTDYTGTGGILIGGDAAGGFTPFKGSIHGLRLWNKARSITEISSKANKLLSGREIGLIGSWQLTEGFGTRGSDDVQGRHAFINGATWSILPQNHAYKFASESNYLTANTGALGFDEETDITLEAWFKTSAAKTQTIFANGHASGTLSFPDAWDIFLDEHGALHVESDGISLKTNDGWNNDVWHHIAIVVERTRAVTLFVDGQPVETGNTSDFGNFAGPRLSIGARVWRMANEDHADRFFEGNIDEVRIWSLARQPEQIKRDRLFQMIGDEPGLVAYYPFDGVKVDLGVALRTPVLTDESENEFDLQIWEVDDQGQINITDPNTTPDFDIEAPPIQLPRLTEKVNFTYSLNNDVIFISLDEASANIENTIVDISVEGIKDLAGNRMSSEITWTAFIDKNQVFWEEEYFNFEINAGEDLQFTTKIVNTGGAQERYNISNLPNWLSVSPSTGIIEPNSSVWVTFTLSSYVNIGAYEHDIFVSTESFDFNERLLIDLKVNAEGPDWEVVPDNYTASMSYIGEVIIDGIISSDPEDIIVAIVNDSIRGIGRVRYSPGVGKHLVYLDINGFGENGGPDGQSSSNGKSLVFQIWDASEDKIYSQITPNDHFFLEGALRGSPSSPIPFATSGEEEITYHLKEGWNWISFPVVGLELDSLDELFYELSLHKGDILTNRKEFVFIDGDTTWIGSRSLVANGVNIQDGYQLLLTKADTFSYTGAYQDPADYPIPLDVGWTSIGVIAEDPIDVTTALANLNPQDGDWIKGQVGFAVYDAGFGWSGTLDYLYPQHSYMIKMADSDTLVYPNLRDFKSDGSERLKSQKKLYVDYEFSPQLENHSMSMVVTIEGFYNWKRFERWYVAAFNGDELKGINEIAFDESRPIRLAYLQVYGEQGDNIHFKLISPDGNASYDLKEGYDLVSDATMGRPHTPLVFHLGNPCATKLSINSNFKSFVSETGFIQAAETVELGTKIEVTKELKVFSGQAIELKPGFEMRKKEALELTIKPCNQ